MIQLSFNKEMIREAVRLAKELGEIPNSITKGRANRAAYLGELSLSSYIEGAELVSCDEGDGKYNRDLLYAAQQFEIKTKRRMVDPHDTERITFDASIADTSVHQKTDYYIHLSITFGKRVGKGKEAVYYNPLRIWFCGFDSKESYFNKARLWEKGDVDSSNDFETHVRMHNVPYKDLIPPENFFSTFDES